MAERDELRELTQRVALMEQGHELHGPPDELESYQIRNAVAQARLDASYAAERVGYQYPPYSKARRAAFAIARAVTEEPMTEAAGTNGSGLSEYEECDVSFETSQEVARDLDAPVWLAPAHAGGPRYEVVGPTEKKDEAFDLVFKKLVECRKRERALLKELGRL